jgi:predicted MFS family arabinose efflux permease
MEFASLEPSSNERISLRGWLIILVIFTADALSLGGRALCLVMILEWEKDLNWNRATSAGLMSLVHICNGIFTPVAGYLIDQRCKEEYVLGGGLAFLALCFACTSALNASWQVWLIYGAMSGSAYGLLNLNVFSVAILRAVPPHRAGLAVGIGTSGSTFGQLVLIPSFTYIIQSFGWRAGYAALSVAAGLLVVPAVLLLRSNKYEEVDVVKNQVITNFEEESDSNDQIEIDDEVKDEVKEDDTNFKSQDSEEKQSFMSVLRMLFTLPQYWALTFAFVVCGITTTGFIESHLIALEVHRGETIAVAAFAFSVLSAVNGVSMIIVGYLIDYYDRHRILATIFFVRAACYVLLLLPVSNHRAILFTFAPIFGFANYSVVPPIVSVF